MNRIADSITRPLKRIRILYGYKWKLLKKHFNAMFFFSTALNFNRVCVHSHTQNYPKKLNTLTSIRYNCRMSFSNVSRNFYLFFKIVNFSTLCGAHVMHR